MNRNNQGDDNIIIVEQFVKECFSERKIDLANEKGEGFKALTEIYDEVREEALKYNVSEVEWIKTFIFHGFNRKIDDIDFALEFFEELSKRKNKSDNIALGLGFAYYLKASNYEIPYFEIVDELRVMFHHFKLTSMYRQAERYLRRGLKIYQNDLVILSALAHCYYGLKYKARHVIFNRALQLYEESVSANKLVSLVAVDALSRVYLFIAKDYIEKGQYAEAISTLKGMRLSSPFGQFLFRRALTLRIAYSSLGQHQDAIRSVMEYRKRFKDDSMCLLVGLSFLRLFQYYRASVCFARALRTDMLAMVPKCEIEVLYEFTSGMWQWKNGFIDQADDHFERAAELITKNNIKKFDVIEILPEILSMDSRINRLAKCDDVDDFFDHLSCLNEDMNSLMFTIYKIHAPPLSSSEIYGQESRNGELRSFCLRYVTAIKKRQRTIDPVKNPLDVILVLLVSKGIYSTCLFLCFMKMCEVEEVVELYKSAFSALGVKIEDDNDLLTFINEMISNTMTILDKVGLFAFNKALDDLGMFIKKFWFTRIEELEKKYKEFADFINELNPSLKKIGYESTSQAINTYLINIGKIEVISVSEKENNRIKPEEEIAKTKTLKIPTITFTPEQVTLNTVEQPILERSRERYFLEYLILTDEIHYLHSVVFLKEQGIHFNPEEFMKNPLVKFKKIKTNLYTNLRHFQKEENKSILPFKINGLEKGFYVLKESEYKRFKSNITDARNIYNAASSLYKEGKTSECIEMLQGKNGAMTKYFNFLDAHKLLARCYIKVGLSNVEKEKIRVVVRFLERRLSWFKGSIPIINQYLNKEGIEIIGNEYDIFNDIKKERDEIEDLILQLTQIPIPQDEEDIKWKIFGEIRDIVAKHASEQNNKAIINELQESRTEYTKVIHELIQRPVNERIEKLKLMNIRARTDEERQREFEERKNEIKLSYFNILIDLLRKKRYERSDFDSWQHFVDFINYHLEETADPPDPAESGNRRVRSYVRKYLGIVRRENLKGKSFAEQWPILKKHGFGRKRFQDVINYLKRGKKVVHDDERDRGTETPR